MDNEKQQIEKCRQRIEEKVGWGPGTEWQNQDFEALSARIYKETKVSLSVSTLKRLWGKIRYEGTPNIGTLNALAQFVGYENWRAFTSNGFTPPSNGTATINGVATKERRKFIGSRVLKAVGIIVAVGIAAALLWWIQSRPKQLKYDNIVFSSQPVTNTVPNTVVFNYNARDSNADSVFIQQSWDPMRRFKVDKNLTEYTSTYYLPGYYSAKLVLDATIVAEHDVFIESNGWLATIDREPIPLYVGEDKILRDGILQLSDDFFVEQQIDLEKEKLWTSFFRVMKDEVVPDKAFQMDVALKNTFGKGALVCQKTQIVLLGNTGAILIPLSIKGCVGELFLQTDESHDGKTNDLSAFGVDFSDWVTVQCRVQNKKISIRVNDVLAFEGDYQNGIGRVVGTRIMFMGTGKVKDFSLKKI
ncbi:hypothetical protein [Chryseolinea soli]|uniref:Uncharacterized protein n=1 Tax=Chryseolinea soli TaxID=2321403 RepID=A0A385SI35_9BACT|nr:hypothetical protein [Chryseolinea soli]AYB29957.1 hypothetical protein D4L85_04900 [Chryseolinea soli]